MSPKVSVLMITYNHEKYIAQAIDSVLMQEVNFPIEIVIGEDFSVDDTRAICREYQKTYPEQILPSYTRPELSLWWPSGTAPPALA